MAFTHADYRFSATLHTDDRAVLNCLRALSQISQREGNVRIPWGAPRMRTGSGMPARSRSPSRLRN